MWQGWRQRTASWQWWLPEGGCFDMTSLRDLLQVNLTHPSGQEASEIRQPCLSHQISFPSLSHFLQSFSPKRLDWLGCFHISNAIAADSGTKVLHLDGILHRGEGSGEIPFQRQCRCQCSLWCKVWIQSNFDANQYLHLPLSAFDTLPKQYFHTEELPRQLMHGMFLWNHCEQSNANFTNLQHMPESDPLLKRCFPFHCSFGVGGRQGSRHGSQGGMDGSFWEPPHPGHEAAQRERHPLWNPLFSLQARSHILQPWALGLAVRQEFLFH